MGSLESLQTWEEVEEQKREEDLELKELSVCEDCQFKKDMRPWWKKLLFPDAVLRENLQCLASPLIRVPLGIMRVEIFAPCSRVNLYGECLKFKPRITYR